MAKGQTTGSPADEFGVVKRAHCRKSDAKMGEQVIGDRPGRAGQ
jgi:hypothetical protein